MQNYQLENQIQKQEKQPFLDDIKNWTYILISDGQSPFELTATVTPTFQKSWVTFTFSRGISENSSIKSSDPLNQSNESQMNHNIAKWF